MVVAGLLGDLALHQPARGLEVEHEDLRFDQRGVDPLALAGALAIVEREHDRLGEQQARGQVGDRDADAHRPAAGLAGDRHQPAHALRDLVDAGARRIGAALAEARDGAVDDARIDLRHRLVVDLEPVLHVGAVVLDDDVGLLRELHEDRVAFLALEVERHRLLVAMQVLEVEAVAAAAHRRRSRAGSGGGSILITSAPQSASWRTAVGPARCAVRSRTLIWERGERSWWFLFAGSAPLQWRIFCGDERHWSAAPPALLSLKAGLRFSMKARRPSLKSSLSKQASAIFSSLRVVLLEFGLGDLAGRGLGERDGERRVLGDGAGDAVDQGVELGVGGDAVAPGPCRRPPSTEYCLAVNRNSMARGRPTMRDSRSMRRKP